jgi:nicotinate dehydrogenase subunit A
MLNTPREMSLRINGAETRITAEPDTPLLYILRNDLQLNGPKYGCGLGECGACAVLIDDHAARSCTVPVGALAGKSVITLEGLGTATAPHPVQTAFIEHQAAQCGYCLNGMIIAVVALLKRNPSPGEETIRDALRHHLCRCGTHMEILAAARSAAGLCQSAPRPVEEEIR